MRRHRLKTLIKRLRELQRQDLTRDDLLLKLGAAKKEAGKAYGLLVIHMPTKDQPVTSETLHFALDRKKLLQARRREGSYLPVSYTHLRPNGPASSVGSFRRPHVP